MKRTTLLFSILTYVFVLTSCSSSEETERNSKMIIGNWTGAEWLIAGKPSGRDMERTHFSFDDKKNYTFDYANTKEAGTYKIENNMLFTTATGKLEIMVKMTKLTKDSLVFDMNNNGQAEVLTLLRK